MAGSFSVLICTNNRAQMLQRSLAALIDGSDDKPDQVVIVNGGDELADQVVKRYANRPSIRVKLIKTVNKNLAASRNVGLPHCDGDIIAMTDDDAEVLPDWVARMKQVHHEHPDVGAAGGAVIGMNTDSFVGRIADQVTFANFSTPRYVRFIAGVNVSYKRHVIERIGWQDETLFRGEDVDYNWRVLDSGYKVFFDPAIRVYHHHRATLRAFLNQHYMYGRAYYLVRRKWPEMYCVYPRGLRKPKDFLKAVNFVAAIFYEPFVYAARLRRWDDRVLAVPILFANQIVWRGGMVRQKLMSK